MLLQQAKALSLKDKLYGQSIETIVVPKEEKPVPIKKKFNKKEKK